MRNRIKPVLLAAAGMIVSAGLLLAGSSQPASAAAPVSLPISSYYQMVVDAAHGHIFISQGSSSQDGILVTDLSGQVITTISGQSGVVGIALSPDGSTLYAALSTADAVTAISTGTLTQTASYPLPAGDSPFNVAAQSGKIWVSYNNGTAFGAAIGFFDPSAASPTLQTPAAMSGWSSAPQLAVDPQDTGVLVATGPSSSPTGLASYDTAANPVTTLAGSPTEPSGCGDEQDVAVSPGGSEFAVACDESGIADHVYSTASLSPLRSLGSPTAPPFNVAISYDAAGDIAAGTTTFVPSPDLSIYSPGSTTAQNTYSLYSLGGPGGILAPRGLAWVPDGSQVFGMLSRGSSFALATIANPTAPPMDPTTTVLNCFPNPVAVGQATSCTAVVTDTVPGGAAPTGQVTFTSDTSGGNLSSSSCTLATGSTIGQASCMVSYTPGQTGSGIQTITASYTGDGSHTASSGQAALTITLRTTTTVLTCQPSTVAIGQAASCTATVTDTVSSPTAPTGKVTFTSDTSGGSLSSSSCTLAPDSTSGQASCVVSYTPGQVGSGTQTITAAYGGDSGHTASSGQAALTVTLRATTTVLTCQRSLLVRQKCTATVKDTSPGSATRPTGTVSFSSSGRGVFSATHCTLSGTGTSASCTVIFQPLPSVPSNSQTITASYGGDSTHQSSTGSTKLR
jgi:YVTN family beta-propeller protein